MTENNTPQEDSPYIYDDPKDKKYRRTQIAGFSVIAAIILGTAAGTGALASITPEPIKHLLNISEKKPVVFESVAVEGSSPQTEEDANLIVAGPISVNDEASAIQPPTPKGSEKGKHVLVPPVFVNGDEDDDEDSEKESEEESEED